MALYQDMRPQTFDEVFGQEAAVTLLKSVVALPVEKRPKVFLLEGVYGCGKTTLISVFARAIGVAPEGPDFKLLDGSKDRSIDSIRNFVDQFGLHPMTKGADGRVFVLDEAHQLLGPSQEALLKKCEDVPPKTYIFFATTEGQKLGKALRSRCKIIPIQAMTPKALYQNMEYVCNKMGVDYDANALKKIAANSDNSCRVSMQILENYLNNGGDAGGAITMQQGTGEKLMLDTYAVCKAVVNKSCPWDTVAQFLKAYSGQDEAVRIAVLNYLNSCVLNSNYEQDRRRFLSYMECFITPLFYAGKAGLTYMFANAWALKK